MNTEHDRWAKVVAELEHQLRVPAVWELEAEPRTRTTMQCQRLLPDRWVALAVPVRAEPRPESDDPEGNLVIGFTDDGPWLFTAGRSNPGLPRDPIGPVTDPSPITFGPHQRDGGVLGVGKLTFVVPYVYGRSVRALVQQLAALDPPARPTEASAGEEE